MAMNQSTLHPSIVALVSLAANIAANHPKKGLCQLERLRGYGVSEEQIEVVVDIARHIREEAGQMLDAEFDGASAAVEAAGVVPVTVPVVAARAEVACCTPTAKGTSCC
jgi:hypothetical protein